jgi:X-linked retinitis pigmentosa GTPase regulator
MEEYTQVFVWGTDTFGQLGLGGKTYGKVYKVPRLCSFNVLIKKISCGEEHSALISQSGYVYTMGSNNEGRLGIDSTDIKQSHSPCLVESLINYKASKVSCGWGHTVIVTELGQAYAWGIGEYGALGNGSDANQWAPCLMTVDEGNVIDADSGSRHTGLIVSDKNNKKLLAMCGAGESGQLGTGRREKELVPVFIELNTEVQQVSCGVFQTGVLTTSNKVYMAGGNSFGQLGLGTKKNCSRFEKVEYLDNVNIIKVCCTNYTAALSDKGYLYVWGSTGLGECSIPNRLTTTQVKDVSIGTNFGIAIDFNNNLLGWGTNLNGEIGIEDCESKVIPTIIPSLKCKNIKQVACGGKFCISLGTDILTKPKAQERKQNTPLVNRRILSELQFTNLGNQKVNKSFENYQTSHHPDRVIEDLKKDITRFKTELEKSKRDKDILDKENRELNIYLEEANNTNIALNAQVNKNKLKIERIKRTVMDEIKKKDDKHAKDTQELYEKIAKEQNKNKSLELSLQRLENEKNSQDNIIRKHQQQIEMEIKILNTKNQNFIDEKNDIEQFYNQELQKYNAEIHGYILKIDGIKNEKDKISVELQNTNYEFSKLAKKHEKLKQKYEKLETEKLNLSNKVGDLTKDSEKTADALVVQIKDLESKCFELKTAKETIAADYNKNYSNLLSQNQISLKENSELTKKLELLSNDHKHCTIEKEKLTQELLIFEQKLSNCISQNEKNQSTLSAEKEFIAKEKNDLINKNNLKDIEIKTIQQTLGEKIAENNSMTQKIEQLKKEIEKLTQISTDQQYAYKKIHESKKSLQNKFDQLSTENNNLKLQLSNLESENRKIFCNLEKDLTQRAKDYKERTMNILNVQRSNSQFITPLVSIDQYDSRSRSPYIRPGTPYQIFENKSIDEQRGNAAANLLKALDKSPRSKSPSTTPTKATIKP